MAQTTFNDGDALSVVRATINGNANDAQGKLIDQIAINTLADLSQFLVSGTYELPSGTYYFNNSIDFVTADILLTDLNGCYDFRTNCIATLTYTGVTPFITSGATGQVIKLDPFRCTTPNATAFDCTLAGGNSFISRFGIFISCKQIIAITEWAFFTVDAFAGVGCEVGCVLTDVSNINISKPQWNLGLNLGGAMFTCLGAASGQIIADSMNSQPASTEFFFDIQSTFGGGASIVGGYHTLGGGSFFKTSGGSLDQTNPNINLSHVKDVTDSRSKAAGYIADGDEVSTTIVTQDVPVVVAGTWTTSLISRFTFDAAGKITYTGIEDMIFPVGAKMLITPASGTNKDYSVYVRKNGTTLDLASRDIASADSGNPAKIVIITELDLVTNDFIELVIESNNSTTDVTCSAVTMII